MAFHGHQAEHAHLDSDLWSEFGEVQQEVLGSTASQVVNHVTDTQGRHR
jgi:hypothetical protein